jgi:deoxyribodipyrimidine photo-lyase
MTARNQPIPAVVWFKRDLRVVDHVPLAAAAASGQVLPLYIIEPSIFAAPDFAAQHWGFIRESLVELNDRLAALGAPLTVRVGEAVSVLAQLQREIGAYALASHQETGNWATFQRDLAVAAWCQANSIMWREYRQHGVIRGLRDRNKWAAKWDRQMSQPLIAEPLLLQPVTAALPSAPTLEANLAMHNITFAMSDKVGRLKGGRSHGMALLLSFLDTRAQHYRSAMSSPLTAERECSRLSPHIAFGTLSIREIAQALYAKRAALHAMPSDARPPGLLASLKSFESRLHWHCHFMQKLESEPEIEFRNVHRGFDGVRNESARSAEEIGKLDAWVAGRTGYPMIDAAMKMLAHTGWINFRMRAMLTSFASYHLWLHWRHSALILAREFCDYEPGIHYPQVQMQSGVTGINTIRIYNPVKQARDQDPDGVFVKTWLPALTRVPTAYIFEPWTMPATLQMHVGVVIGRDYPAPIVDNATAMRTAREAIYAVKQRETVKVEAARVYDKHGSRHPARDRAPQRAVNSLNKPPRLERVEAAAASQLAFSWD